MGIGCSSTPLRTNMEPENTLLEKEKHLQYKAPILGFQLLVFRGVYFLIFFNYAFVLSVLFLLFLVYGKY